jgi:hypothetical protein
MAEAIFFESTINNAGGSCTVRVFFDDVTGKPTRIEADTTLPRAYQLFFGLPDKSQGVSLTINRRNMRLNIPPGIQNLLDVRCEEGQLDCDSWVCGLEGR